MIKFKIDNQCDDQRGIVHIRFFETLISVLKLAKSELFGICFS